MKSLYGEVALCKDELIESNIDYMKLKYYKIKENLVKEGECRYGLEVTKNEYNKENENVESCKIDYISNDEEIADSVIKAMIKYKVTPCTLKEDIVEYLKLTKDKSI